jgi:hypothetical protein
VGATLLCGLPGLTSLCCGAALWLASTSPETNFSGDMTPEMTRTLGIAGVCVGVLFVLIPLVIGFFTLRRKPDLPVVGWDEPIPPAI